MPLLIYRLLDPDAVTPHHAALRSQLFAALRGVRLVEPIFISSPFGAGFRYVDEGHLWHGSSRARLAKSAHEAALAAKTFMLAVDEGAALYRAQRHVTTGAYPDPFPVPLLRHMASRLVSQPGAKQPDHWVSCWMLFLPAEVPPPGVASPRRAPVQGGEVEIRLGNDNEVIAISSSLRGWHGTTRVDAFPPPKTAADPDGGDTLVYLMDAPSEPQSRLVPFYHTKDAAGHAHGLSLRPACAQSLLVDIGVEILREGARLGALVMDPSGEMRAASRSAHSIRWAHARLDQLAAGESVESSSFDLRLTTTGVYHVEVSVEDRRTGIRRTTFRQIVIGLPIERTRAGVS